MNKAERFLLHGTGYTTLIVSLFYAFAAMLDLDSLTMSAGRFFLILLFGFTVSGVEVFIWKLKLKTWLKLLILYITTLAAFLLVFLLGAGILKNGAGSVFAAAAIYTFVYFVSVLLVYLVRRYLFKNAPKSSAEKRTKAASKRSDYKSLYKE